MNELSVRGGSALRQKQLMASSRPPSSEFLSMHINIGYLECLQLDLDQDNLNSSTSNYRNSLSILTTSIISRELKLIVSLGQDYLHTLSIYIFLF